jgi:uracil phosphoribosyltransferase
LRYRVAVFPIPAKRIVSFKNQLTPAIKDDQVIISDSLAYCGESVVAAIAVGCKTVGLMQVM